MWEIEENDSIPRKWEWVAEKLKTHEDMPKDIIETAEHIDQLLSDLYGEHVHTVYWIDQYESDGDDTSLHNIGNVAIKTLNCTACALMRREHSHYEMCKYCEFGKKAGVCSQVEEPSLFHNFSDAFFEYFSGLKGRV